MRYQPINESSLRHLFSSKEAEDRLRLRYVGPVLGADGKRIESSPDCYIIDARARNPRFLRAEFKFAPTSKADFVDNGRFDVAIVWELPLSNKENLRRELGEQNGCEEILVLNEYKYFRDLKKYGPPNMKDFLGLAILEKLKLNHKPHAHYAAYVIAKMHPIRCSAEKLSRLLFDKFLYVRTMSAQGRGNAFSCLLQFSPPLIKKAASKTYEWNDGEVNHETAWRTIKDFMEIAPVDEEIRSYLE